MADGTWPYYDDHSAVFTNRIPYLFCPSDGNAPLPSFFTSGAKNNYMRNSYCGSMGDAWSNTDVVKRNNRGFFPGGKGISKSSHADKLFFINGIEDVLDGTSNTIAVSELVTSADSDDRRIKSSYIYGISDYNPSTCNNQRLDATFLSLVTFTSSPGVNTRGYLWTAGYSHTSYFNTILPPNSPTCVNSGKGSPALASAASNHSGGVNAVLADGSIRFISETIHCGTLDRTGEVETGQSPYGVWGALGSINGGETTSLD